MELKHVNVYYTDSLTSAMKVISILEDREWGIESEKKKSVKWNKEISELCNKHEYAKCCFLDYQVFLLDSDDKKLLENNEEFKNVLKWQYIIIEVE